MSGDSGDLQRPRGKRGLPAHRTGVRRGDRAIGATSPWTAGPDTAWWREDSATPAGTSTPPWRTEATAGTTDELPKAPADTDELPQVTDGNSGYGQPAPETARPPYEAGHRADPLPVSISRPGKPPKPPRNRAVGLVSLVLLSLLAAFFAWVSAEPLWLAVGHGKTGSATVTRCTGDGVRQRCVGTFTAASGGFTERVRLLGVEDRQRTAGTQVTARMIDTRGHRAYVGSGAGALHLRWALGLTLVVLCGLGIVWGTGALRLTDRRSRRRATITALAAPMVVAVGFFAAAF